MHRAKNEWLLGSTPPPSGDPWNPWGEVRVRGHRPVDIGEVTLTKVHSTVHPSYIEIP